MNQLTTISMTNSQANQRIIPWWEEAVNPVPYTQMDVSQGNMKERLMYVMTEVERYSNRRNPEFLSKLELKDLLKTVPEGTIVNIDI